MANYEFIQRGEKMFRIQFEKLFGRFNYNVILNSEGLTILTGPNGYGKSTVLKSIEAIGNEFEGLWFFFNLDFKKIIAFFENDRKIVIEKNEEGLIVNNIAISKYFFKRHFEDIIDRRSSYIRLDDNTWLDRRRGNTVTLNDYITEIYTSEEQVRGKNGKKILFPKLIDLLKEMKELVGEIYFISEQRLIRTSRKRFEEKEVINVIEELPRQFKELMSSVQQDYSIVANKIDSTYLSRLFETKEGITENEYKMKMQETAAKFLALSKYDLSTMQDPVNFIFKDEHAKALKVYFDDFEIKYQAYEDFIYKLDLYTDIINHRLSFKSLKISKEFGISIIDENDKYLELKQLSSGEKQEIVLFYDLIFGTNKNILLLIDEPEISLHITWQKKFMDDLLRIIEFKKLNVVVATHSPQIINNHWERQIDLGELYGKQLNQR